MLFRSYYSYSRLSISKNSNSIRLNSRGFTLIEIIVGMVVLSIALSIVSTLIAPTEKKSADQILQVKAAELGQSFLNDISSRAFDENSDMVGGLVRCGEPGDGSNPCSTVLGPEAGETTRDLFDDVDDFNGYTLKYNASGQGLHPSYANFTIKVDVVFDGVSLGLVNEAAKRITVTVITPLDTEIKFATHKANF